MVDKFNLKYILSVANNKAKSLKPISLIMMFLYTESVNFQIYIVCEVKGSKNDKRMNLLK